LSEVLVGWTNKIYTIKGLDKRILNFLFIQPSNIGIVPAGTVGLYTKAPVGYSYIILRLSNIKIV